MYRLVICLLLLQVVRLGEAGSCEYGGAQSPKHYLSVGSTRATISGSGVQINPVTDLVSGSVLEDEYIRAEVLFLRELSLDTPDGKCISSADLTSWERNSLQSLDLVSCDCSHSTGSDYFPGTDIRRDFVRVAISCAYFPTTSLVLDVNIVNGSYDVPHPTANDSSVFTYDRFRYAHSRPLSVDLRNGRSTRFRLLSPLISLTIYKLSPDEIKFNVTVTDWPWSGNPTGYGVIFVNTSVHVSNALLTTNTSTEKLSVVIENSRLRFTEGIQRSFVLDGASYVTPIPSSSTSPFEPAPDFSLVNGIPLCWDDRPILSHPRVISYDPTLSASFFGDPPLQNSPAFKNNRSNNLVLKIALPVTLGTLGIIIIFTVIAYNTPAVKNFFRPFRNPDKDGRLV